MSYQSKSDLSENFTGFRKIFWPVHNYELRKVVSLSLMLFLIIFNYTILRNSKDGLIITAPGSGAELISFLKLYGTLSFAIITMALYSKLSLILSKPKLFFSMISIFIAFFTIFGYVLFPLKDILHASPETITAWQQAYPRFHWFVPMFGNWTYSLFYIMSELWGTVAMNVLFWQFANEITSVKESKRLYPLFGMLSSFGTISSGCILYYITNKYSHLNPTESWDLSLKFIINIAVFNMLLIICFYNWIYKNIALPQFNQEAARSNKKKSKLKLTFAQSIRTVLNSKYITLIMMLTVCYGISINLIEVTWKSQMKLQFHETSEYVKIMGLFSVTTGISVIILNIIGGYVLRTFGWFVTAIVTPSIFLITGSLFFGFIIFEDHTTRFLAVLSMTPLLMTVIIGWIQNILSKGVKYAMFDATKEMAYIPLSDELRVIGKATADGIGSRLGKSGGAIIQQLLLFIFVGASQISLAPIISCIFIVCIIIWLTAVVKLNAEFEVLNAQNKQDAELDIDTSSQATETVITTAQPKLKTA